MRQTGSAIQRLRDWLLTFGENFRRLSLIGLFPMNGRERLVSITDRCCVRLTGSAIQRLRDWLLRFGENFRYLPLISNRAGSESGASF